MDIITSMETAGDVGVVVINNPNKITIKYKYHEKNKGIYRNLS